MELVLVQHEFEYKAKDGRLVSIKPNESYILVSKTNEHWWHVRKDQCTRPFYIPAQYVKEITSHSGDSPGTNKLDKAESGTTTKPVDMADVTQSETVLRLSTHNPSRETYRFSTFGFCDNIPDIKPCETQKGGQTTNSFAPVLDNIKTNSTTGGFPLTPAPLKTDSVQLYSKPHPVPKPRNRQEQSKSSLQDVQAKQAQTVVDDNKDDDLDFPLPPDSPIYDTIPEINVTEFDTFPEPPSPVTLNHILASQQESLNQSAEATSSTDTLSLEQVRFSCHVGYCINVLLITLYYFHFSIIKMCHCDFAARRGCSFIMKTGRCRLSWLLQVQCPKNLCWIKVNLMWLFGHWSVKAHLCPSCENRKQMHLLENDEEKNEKGSDFALIVVLSENTANIVLYLKKITLGGISHQQLT